MEWADARGRERCHVSVYLDPRARDVMSGNETPIFLATLDTTGRPNCVPMVSLVPYGANTLIFGDFMMHKSRANLLTNARVGIAVFSPAFEAWSIKGTFLGFETQGEHFDYMNRSPMFRYNAYTGVRAAGLIRIEEVSKKHCLSKPRLLLNFSRARVQAPFLRSLNGRARCMPPQVEEKFRRLSAVRAFAFRDADGFPRAFPLLACLPAGPNRLLVSDPLLDEYKAAIPRDADVAVCVLTLDAVSYQVKGPYRGTHAGVSIIDLTACYSASPPLVGDRLDRPTPPVAGDRGHRPHTEALTL